MDNAFGTLSDANIAAANAATKPAGDAWWWDRRKSPVDVAPLIAVMNR